MREVIKVLLLLACSSTFACDYPDEGNMPLRRAVTKVETLPEVDAWMRAARKDGAVTQVAVLAGQSVREGGRCYWPVEVRAGDRVWRRYLVTPDGSRVIRPASPTPASR